MWQIHNTIQDSPFLSSNSNHDRNQNSHNLIQQFKWKYGKVYLSSRQQLTQLKISPDLSWVMITIEPFYNQINSNNKYQQFRDRTILVKSGQQNKNLQAVDQLCHMMFKLGVNRQSTVYILGGGMLLDMAGFACSIYMRGIKKVVYIPTTLLAIVDATVGGKNGINWNEAKNMLGVIKHAHQIRISMHYLDSLSDRQFSNGLAEVIKMSITHDKQLFQFLQKDTITLATLQQNRQLLRILIKKSLQIKIKVVEKDQYDSGERNWLNFGHTIGHAIELGRTGLNLMHGQCVSIGQKIGQIKDKKIYTRIEKILKKYKLPTKIPQNTIPSQIIKLMTKDKKNKQVTKIELALIQQIGIRKNKTTSIPTDKLYQHFSNIVCVSSLKQTIKIQEANQLWEEHNKFPSSKSLSIRYLFLAALHYYRHKQTLVIKNFLFSDDTQCIRESLISLGFIIKYNLQQKIIQVSGYEQKKSGTINVGNSGLTARFILPLCCHIQGQWTILCHPRMSERPNKQIFQYCKSHYNTNFQYLNSDRQQSFPVKVLSKGLQIEKINEPITINSQQSSQFVSSIILNSYLWMRNIEIKIPSDKLVSESFIHMTIECMKQFGSKISQTKDNKQIMISIDSSSIKNIEEITIEKDLSSFSYPYALSLIHSQKLPELPKQSKQGDLKFYQYCDQLLNNRLPSQLYFSECTDTFMTFSIILGTNYKNRFNIKHQYIKITGIANQRVKQSNRLQLIKQNLAKIGYYIQQTNDGLLFPIQSHPYFYKNFISNSNIIFQTAGDHRLAMSMAILATYLAQNQNISKLGVKFIIDDKNAVNKTFPSFWEYMIQAGINLNYNLQLTQSEIKNTHRLSIKKEKHNKIVLLGNRGCGKTSIGKLLGSNQYLGNRTNYTIDIDEQITKQIITIKNNKVQNIKQFVQYYGWQQFRILENKMIDKFVNSNYLDNLHNNGSGQVNYIICTGGGVVDWQYSEKLLIKQNRKHINIYIQKQLQNLQIELNDNRPLINNLQQKLQKRSKKYEQISDYIITIGTKTKQIKQNNYKYLNKYIITQFNRIYKSIQQQSIINPGILYCVPRVYQDTQYGKTINWTTQQQFIQQNTYNTLQNDKITGIQLRVDSIIQHALISKPQISLSINQLIKQCRYSIAKFKYINNQIIANLPIILTLRTINQFGLFPNTSFTASTSQLSSYYKWVNQLHKIPTQFIDYQYNQYLNNQNSSKSKFVHNYPKYIYSYHGQNISTIQNLINQKHLPIHSYNPLIKICYNGSHNIWEQHQRKWQQRSDICINLRNPMSRLSKNNKYKMVIAQNDRSNIIQIPKRRQLRLLSSLQKLFTKF